jgi:hypothetical protein
MIVFLFSLMCAILTVFILMFTIRLCIEFSCQPIIGHDDRGTDFYKDVDHLQHIVWAQEDENEDLVPWDGKNPIKILCWDTEVEGEAPLATDADGEQLAAFLDENYFEDEDNQVHQEMYRMWVEKVGKETADTLMKQLASRGGLEGLIYATDRDEEE